MNIEARKYQIIERVIQSDEVTLDRIESFLESYDLQLEKELIASALKSEEDIQLGNTISIDKANHAITNKLSS